MAKELPYFQFEPAEYLTKDISFCSLSAQGLFINICAFYWQRECQLTKTQVLRRFNYPDVLKELIQEEIIKTDENENIVISFLLSQYESIVQKKSNDSEKGKIGNLKRWHKDIYDKFIKKELSLNEALIIAKESGGDNLAIAKTSQIREDKIKEDNKKVSKPSLETRSLAFKESLRPFLNQYGADMLKSFYNYWSEPNQSKTKMLFEMQKTWDNSRRLATWSKREKDFTKKEDKPKSLGI